MGKGLATEIHRILSIKSPYPTPGLNLGAGFEITSKNWKGRLWNRVNM